MKYLQAVLLTLILFLIGGLGVSITKNNNKEEKEYNENIITLIENTNFIEKETSTDKYKIIKENLNTETLKPTNEKRLPRTKRINKKFRSDVKKGFEELDLLGDKTLDEQVYIVCNYYIASNDKEKANQYIKILEENINTKQDELQQKEDQKTQEAITENEKDAMPWYFAMAFGIASFIVITISGIINQITNKNRPY